MTNHGIKVAVDSVLTDFCRNTDGPLSFGMVSGCAFETMLYHLDDLGLIEVLRTWVNDSGIYHIDISVLRPKELEEYGRMMVL